MATVVVEVTDPLCLQSQAKKQRRLPLLVSHAATTERLGESCRNPTEEAFNGLLLLLFLGTLDDLGLDRKHHHTTKDDVTLNQHKKCASLCVCLKWWGSQLKLENLNEQI